MKVIYNTTVGVLVNLPFHDYSTVTPRANASTRVNAPPLWFEEIIA